MVMEVPPSPQCVGREFVRQYYTLLNEAPAHLHRFYNNSSSFIHGGLDPPNRETALVVGQRQIHQQIQQLNFRDCHAKITQVDSQATLGNGVVVQVTGELSNGGQPMRRFTQTFVLAFQAPKKYYVHNDIFRYQDMLTEEEFEEMSRLPESDVQANAALIQQQNNINKQANQLVEDASGEYYGVRGVQMVNGDGEHHLNESQDIVVEQPTEPLPPTIHHQSPPSQPPPMVEKEESIYESNATEIEQQPIISSHAVETSVVGGDVVKTYANLVKGSGGTPSNVYVPYSPPQQLPTTPVQPQNTTPPGAPKVERPKPQRETPVKETFRRNEETPLNNDVINNSGYDEGRKPQPQYSDSHQLFMGNVPHTATVAELKEIFGKFGAIVDLRILSKPGTKGPGGMKVPNFGFIIFEEVSSVQAVLGARPIMYPDNNGVKLNVEEKKTKGGRSEGGGGRGGRGGGRGGGLGPARGAPRPPPAAPSSAPLRYNRR